MEHSGTLQNSERLNHWLYNEKSRQLKDWRDISYELFSFYPDRMLARYPTNIHSPTSWNSTRRPLGERGPFCSLGNKNVCVVNVRPVLWPFSLSCCLSVETASRNKEGLATEDDRAVWNHVPWCQVTDHVVRGTGTTKVTRHPKQQGRNKYWRFKAGNLPAHIFRRIEFGRHQTRKISPKPKEIQSNLSVKIENKSRKLADTNITPEGCVQQRATNMKSLPISSRPKEYWSSKLK